MTCAFTTLVVLSLVSGAGADAPRENKHLPILLKAEHLFLGNSGRAKDWGVLVMGEKIAEIGPIDRIKIPLGARVIELRGKTLMPGMIDAHTHMLLHPYNETSWNDQVLKEPQALRVARATNHLRATLFSGFTTIRDLGTEGAGYADVGLKQAVEQGIIPGPRMLVTTRAIVATGSYAPKGFAPEHSIPQGAEEADGVDNLIKVVRSQIGKGADWIKVYSDAAMGGQEVRPSFTLEEMKRIVETAGSTGVRVTAHAVSKEGMRRAAMAGVATIEHGDEGDAEIFRLMAERKVAYGPTLAAAEAMSRYSGWRPGTPEPARLTKAKNAVRLAREAGVLIANGSDMGVFTHGEGVRELELLHDAGLTNGEVLNVATSNAAKALGIHEQVGSLFQGAIADIIAVEGDPHDSLLALRKVRLVMKAGVIVVDPEKKADH